MEILTRLRVKPENPLPSGGGAFKKIRVEDEVNRLNLDEKITSAIRQSEQNINKKIDELKNHTTRTEMLEFSLNTGEKKVIIGKEMPYLAQIHIRALNSNDLAFATVMSCGDSIFRTWPKLDGEVIATRDSDAYILSHQGSEKGTIVLKVQDNMIKIFNPSSSFDHVNYKVQIIYLQES